MAIRREPPPQPRRDELRPWLPTLLAEQGLGQGDAAQLTYIVVDELIGDTLGLSLSPWPSADPDGRLRFDVGDGPKEIVVSGTDLLDYLQSLGPELVTDRRGVDPQPPPPSLRVGDVFAAKVEGTVPDRWNPPLERFLPPPVYDMTLEAREVAKLAYYGAVADTWEEDDAERLGLREVLG